MKYLRRIDKLERVLRPVEKVCGHCHIDLEARSGWMLGACLLLRNVIGDGRDYYHCKGCGVSYLVRLGEREGGGFDATDVDRVRGMPTRPEICN